MKLFRVQETLVSHYWLTEFSGHPDNFANQHGISFDGR